MCTQSAKKKKIKNRKRNRKFSGRRGLKFRFYNIWGNTWNNWGRDPWECLGRRDPGRRSSRCKGSKTGVRGATRGRMAGVGGGREQSERGTEVARARLCRALYVIVKSLNFPLSKLRVLSEYSSIFKWLFWLYWERMKWTNARDTLEGGATVQKKEHGGLDRSGDSGGSGEWWDPGCTLRVVPKEFAERLDVGWEKQKEVKTDSSF